MKKKTVIAGGGGQAVWIRENKAWMGGWPKTCTRKKNTESQEQREDGSDARKDKKISYWSIHHTGEVAAETIKKKGKSVEGEK